MEVEGVVVAWVVDRTKIYTSNSTNRFAVKWLCKYEVEPTENQVRVKLISNA